MASYNIRQGDTFTVTWTITNADGTATNLTGATVRLVVIDRNGTEIAAQDQTSHDTPASGITTVTLSAATTSAFAMGCYDYQGVVTLSDATVWTFETGTIEVKYDYD